MEKLENKTFTKVNDFWYCSRCDISSETKESMCPCPRGSCEAEIVGEVVTTVEIKLNK